MEGKCQNERPHRGFILFYGTLFAFSVVTDTVQAGLTAAAENFVKSATFYDVTVEPMGRWFNKTYEQMERGQMNNDSPIGQNLNLKQNLINGGGDNPEEQQ